ncbi:MAG: GNAT family N-acetyltransferase [Pseudomonadota bacterium]
MMLGTPMAVVLAGRGARGNSEPLGEARDASVPSSRRPDLIGSHAPLRHGSQRGMVGGVSFRRWAHEQRSRNTFEHGRRTRVCDQPARRPALGCRGRGRGAAALRRPGGRPMGRRRLRLVSGRCPALDGRDAGELRDARLRHDGRGSSRDVGDDRVRRHLPSRRQARARGQIRVSDGRLGRGLATEFVLGLVAYAWDVLALPRLEATVAAGNAASARMLEKSGFAF